MIKTEQRNKLFTSGLIAGAITPFLLSKIVAPLLGWLGAFVPAVQLKLAPAADIVVNIRQSLTGINSTLATYLTNLLGITVPSNMLTMIATAAVGGGLLFLGGAYIADWMNLLDKGTARQKTSTVIFIGSAAIALALGGTAISIGVPLVNTLIAFGINAGILSALYVWLENQFKLELIPF